MYIRDLGSRIPDPSNEKKKEKENFSPTFFAAINFTKFRNFEGSKNFLAN
jgi:hypothetical protein